MIVQDLYPGITDLLMGRAVPQAKMAEAIRKSALELSEDYKFSELQVTGPVVQLVPHQPNYDTSFFIFTDPVLPPGWGVIPFPAPKLNKVNSFFLYNDLYITPGSSGYEGANAGYELTFKTVDNIEVLINTSGKPINWTRYSGQIWFGSNPDQNYSIRMRCQPEHPFPSAGTHTAGSDTLMFPNTWQDVLEHAAAQRLAAFYNLSTKASELNARLHGDAQFQQTAGVSGSPGLIFRRTSDEERDQTTTMKRFRLRMRSVI